MPNSRILILALFALALVVFGLGLMFMLQANQTEFDGQRALADADYQMALGPRVPESEAHEAAVQWMSDSLIAAGWEVEIQQAEALGHPLSNVIATRGSGSPWIILGAHYDSRIYADKDADPAGRELPVPGANDGASGVAVLLELARSLPPDLRAQIWLVMFDAEDNGGIPGWDWILGSRAFAESLQEQPDAVVIVDMIGDSDLQIYFEANSDVTLREQIWATAAELGLGSVFINEVRHSMLDDHTPFLQLGIPAVDIIDFDYPYWHTRADTLDKISAESLNAVGDTLMAWLLCQANGDCE
ncbi:MAG: M28 family peptidase [Anaerolineales bacterium]